MRTVLDVDERIVALARAQASKQGRSLDALVEEGLRLALHIPTSSFDVKAVEAEPLESNDRFFADLEEVRKLGRAGEMRNVSLDQ